MLLWLPYAGKVDLPAASIIAVIGADDVVWVASGRRTGTVRVAVWW
jgi:hypothetical protein